MRQEAAYLAVQSICREYNVSISRMCAIAGIARASYYKWLNREIPEAELLNEAIAEAVMSIHKEYPDKGHRRIRDDLHCNHHFDTRKRLHPPKYRRCITLHPGIGSGYSSFYGQLQSSLFFHEKRDINAPGSVSLPFFIIQLSGSRSFPLTSCAFSALFLSRCSIASWFHTFPHLRLSEATQNPCPLCRLSSYRGTR